MHLGALEVHLAELGSPGPSAVLLLFPDDTTVQARFSHTCYDSQNIIYAIWALHSSYEQPGARLGSNAQSLRFRQPDPLLIPLGYSAATASHLLSRDSTTSGVRCTQFQCSGEFLPWTWLAQPVLVLEPSPLPISINSISQRRSLVLTVLRIQND